ncbi:unnamed protein product [Closterium sp. NIES-64]|nr:unnamed protein product [Closterium sp. NIES-64]
MSHSHWVAGSYPGERSVDDLVEFTNRKMDTNVQPPAPPPSHVVTLLPNSFDAMVLNPPLLPPPCMAGTSVEPPAPPPSHVVTLFSNTFDAMVLKPPLPPAPPCVAWHGRHQCRATSATAIARGTSVEPPAPPPSHVVTLLPNTFDAVVLDPSKFVLVEFYAPWCSFCQDLAPAYEQLGRAFRDEENVVIAKLDASKHRELKERYSITGYPTILWFPPSNKQGESYEGAWELRDLLAFVNRAAGTHRTNTGMLSDMAGRIAALDELARGFIAASKEGREERLGKAERVTVSEEESK